MNTENILIYPVGRDGESVPIIREAIYFNTDNYKKFKEELNIRVNAEEYRPGYDE